MIAKTVKMSCLFLATSVNVGFCYNKFDMSFCVDKMDIID